MKYILAIVTMITLSSCSGIYGKGDDRGTAFMYVNRETGKLLYCRNDQGTNTRDFRFVGTGNVPSKDIRFCTLEKN